MLLTLSSDQSREVTSRIHDRAMEGMLDRAGFTIDSADYAEGFRATYVCHRR